MAKISLSEFLAKVGDENLMFQNILHSTPTLKKNKSDGMIKFYTERGKVESLINEAAGLEPVNWIGLVVWIPREKLPPELKGL